MLQHSKYRPSVILTQVHIVPILENYYQTSNHKISFLQDFFMSHGGGKVLWRAYFSKALIHRSSSMEMLQPDSSGKQHDLNKITLHCCSTNYTAMTIKLLKKQITDFWRRKGRSHRTCTYCMWYMKPIILTKNICPLAFFHTITQSDATLITEVILKVYAAHVAG